MKTLQQARRSVTLGFALGLLGVSALGCRTVGNQSAALADDDTDPGNFPTIDFRSVHKVDVRGIPFGDTVLNEFDSARNLGANNITLQDDFILRFAHLAETHARDMEALGFESCYHYDATHPAEDTSDYRDYQSGPNVLVKPSSVKRLARDLWRARDCFFQRVKLPASVPWRTPRTPADLQEPRVISLFLPNTMSVYLETNGSWPFGERPSDQMPSRFAALFLKMGDHQGNCSGNSDIESLRQNNQTPDAARTADELCDLESLNRPTKGRVSTSYHGWHTTTPMVPFNPVQHTFVDDTGKTVVGFPEDKFPFLLPPNPGPGYYQTVDDTSGGSAEARRVQLVVVQSDGHVFALADYDAHAPYFSSHPYCTKSGDNWSLTHDATSACEAESFKRYGNTGHYYGSPGGQLSKQGQEASYFYQSCVDSMVRACGGDRSENRG